MIGEAGQGFIAEAGLADGGENPGVEVEEVMAGAGGELGVLEGLGDEDVTVI